jgi:hypothetical protein
VGNRSLPLLPWSIYGDLAIEVLPEAVVDVTRGLSEDVRVVEMPPEAVADRLLGDMRAEPQTKRLKRGLNGDANVMILQQVAHLLQDTVLGAATFIAGRTGAGGCRHGAAESVSRGPGSGKPIGRVRAQQHVDDALMETVLDVQDRDYLTDAATAREMHVVARAEGRSPRLQLISFGLVEPSIIQDIRECVACHSGHYETGPGKRPAPSLVVR